MLSLLSCYIKVRIIPIDVTRVCAVLFCMLDTKCGQFLPELKTYVVDDANIDDDDDDNQIVSK